MVQLPFDIPKSLASYLDQFDEDPAKATVRLKEQLRKRGPDAVGHFLLAWFYHLKDMNDQAIEHALKAKIYAPGSPFLGKLHYYLAHPNLFDAWQPSSSTPPSKTFTDSRYRPGPVLDLDALIEKLSDVESTPIKASSDVKSAASSSEQQPHDVDDIVSETLATIHETQGKTEAAIQTYKRLTRLNKDKKDYYKQQITRLEDLRNKRENNSDSEEEN